MDLKSLINPVEEYKPIFKLCKWRGCTERFMDDQTLFEHVNEQHIGRKKNDNLCLSCHWENCRVICSKRDHITSHLKVHIPIKPYKCSKCPKAFKRAQDLTKHMRSHQDFKGSPTASTPNSDYTISEAGVPTIPIEVEHIDGYLSDPGVDVSYFDEKGHQKKRKSDMLAMLSQNVKYRRIERSIHLK